MALNSMGLGVTFTARDAMSGVLFRLQRAFSGLDMQSRAAVASVGAGFAGMAAGIGVVTAGLAGLEGSMNLAAQAGNFESGIQRVGLVAQASVPQIDAMREAVLDASKRTGFNTAEVTKGLEEITALGFTGAQAMAMLGPALDLAAAGGISVADAAEAMGSAMKVFSIEATPEAMRETASKLLGIANTTALQASDLRIALGTVGRGASAAAQNLDEVLIMMGLVKNTGVDATVAASSVSSALLYMAENADKFRKVGVEVENANGSIRDMGDVFLDLDRVLASNPSMTENITVIKDLLQRFGITAYQGVITQLTKGGIEDKETGAIYRGIEALEYLRAYSQRMGTEDLAGKNAAKMLEGWERLSARLTVITETIRITLGQGFLDVILPMLKIFVDGLSDLETLLRQLPPEVKRFGAGLVIVGSLFAVAAGTALIFSGALAVLAGAFILAAPAMLTFLGAFLAIAIPLTVATLALTAAFVGLGAILYFGFAHNLGNIGTTITDTFNRWKLIFQATAEFFSKGELSGALADEFGAADKELQDTVKGFTLFFKKVEVGFKAFSETFAALLESRAVPALKNFWGELLKLTDALGITDNAYYRMTKAMDKGDWAAQGALMAETLVSTFTTVVNAAMITLKVVRWVIELVEDLFNMIYQNKYMIAGFAAGFMTGGLPGAVVGGFAGMMGDKVANGLDNSQTNLEQQQRDRQAQVNQLEFEVESYKLRHGLTNAALPTVTSKTLDAEQQQRYFEILYNQFKDLHDPTKKVYTLENKLYIDGKVVYESVKEHAKSDSADTFSTDSPWSE
jgi:TP901 family phage tail tape measure protein